MGGQARRFANSFLDLFSCRSVHTNLSALLHALHVKQSNDGSDNGRRSRGSSDGLSSATLDDQKVVANSGDIGESAEGHPGEKGTEKTRRRATKSKARKRKRQQ